MVGRLVDLGQTQTTNPGSSLSSAGIQIHSGGHGALFCQVVGKRLARPSYHTFQLLESGPMDLSPEAAKPEIAPMPKAVGQDQAHPATICHLTLANLDQQGLSNLRPDVPVTLICGSGKIHGDSDRSLGAGGASFLLLLSEGHPLIVPLN